MKTKVFLKKYLTLILTCYFATCLSATIQQLPNKLPLHTSPTTGQLWNLHDVDIHSVIDEVSRQTHKNFIIDPRVQGKVTVISNKVLQPDEVYQAFLAILQVHGYAAVPSGNVIKIVPSVNASQLNLQLATSQHPGEGDEIIVRIVPLKSNSADQLVPILRSLLPVTGTISAYAPTNVLIISGNADNVDKLVELVEQIDTANDKNIAMVPLHYAIAGDIVKEITPLLSSSPYLQNSNATLAADDRSNTILINGNYAQRLKMINLIRQLDQRTNQNGAGNTQVIYLHYLKAKDLVPVLAGLVGNAAKINTQNTQEEAQPAVVTNKNAPPANPATGGVTTSTITTSNNQQIQIEAESSDNALIITAPGNIMRTLKTVVMKLDKRPAQVLVEAAVVELDESRLKQLGIQWGTRQLAGDTASILPSDTQFSTLTGGLGIGFIHHGSLKALVSALARDGTTNILSTPTVIVMNNQKADIKVGQNVPFVTGSYGTNTDGSLNNPYTITQREFVGLNLKVTPQINEGNSVRFAIEQGNESISGGSSSSGTVNPITDESHINTSVLINSGEILVLGGLISNQTENVKHKIPVLGDIPGIGLLFQDNQHTVEKKNLMVFLRPVILRTVADNDQVSHNKYDRSRQLQKEDFGDSVDVLMGEGPGILPNKNGKVELPQPFVNAQN